MGQKVYRDVTQSGTHGLFTGGYLAWPFRDAADLATFNADPAGYCQKLGFTLVVRGEK